MTRTSARVALALLGAASFALVTTTNRLAAHWVRGVPGLADSCMASFVLCLALYHGIRPTRPLARPLPSTDWRRVVRLSAAWLAVWVLGSALAAFLGGNWIRYRLAEGPAQLLGFLVTGPAQEELLFRGALYELVERSEIGCSPRAPILVTTILFALHHLQLHGYHLTQAALLQLAFAVPMGLVFATLRARTASLWPGFVVHVLTNVPGVFGAA